MLFKLQGLFPHWNQAIEPWKLILFWRCFWTTHLQAYSFYIDMAKCTPPHMHFFTAPTFQIKSSAPENWMLGRFSNRLSRKLGPGKIRFQGSPGSFRGRKAWMRCFEIHETIPTCWARRIMPPKVILKVRTRAETTRCGKVGWCIKGWLQTLKWQFILAIPINPLYPENIPGRWTCELKMMTYTGISSFRRPSSGFTLMIRGCTPVWRLEDGIASQMESLGLAIEDYSEPKYVDLQ